MVVLGVVNGRRQSSFPPSSDTPTKYFCVKVTTCGVPDRSNNNGEPYAGPSPFQLHRTSPVAASNAVKAPLSCPLHAQEIGMSLTENFAMLPASSVSGFYLAHPEATYFAVGPIVPAARSRV